MSSYINFFNQTIMKELLEQKLEAIIESQELDAAELQAAKLKSGSDKITLLTQAANGVTLAIGEEEKEEVIELQIVNEEMVIAMRKGRQITWNVNSLAALHALIDNMNWLEESLPGKKYTREGMKKRVLQERQQKASVAEYRVELADSIYGEHTLYNERGVAYKITLWDLEFETGYINNIDWRTNKLGTTKHIMFLYNYLKNNEDIVAKLNQTFPFVEITLDPLNNYKITWKYPHELEAETAALLKKHFGNKNYIENHQIPKFLPFLSQAGSFDNIKIRPEVQEKIERYFNWHYIAGLKDQHTIDYSPIKATLYDYQKEGVEFALYKPAAIIADEMGLGKTIQAIAVSVLKKDLFDFSRTLIICPASLKHQWKSEIEKFSDEKAIVVEGKPEERKELYFQAEPFFFIINYETVLRDLTVINGAKFDFVILDEAQKIKNYETKIAGAVKRIKKEQSLVITGTPVENRLIDLFSIVQFLDPYFLSPLWEFSYQHCIFDPSQKNRIVGYYNLNNLKERLSQILIRREKRNVIKQLPSVQMSDIPIPLHEEQASLHAGFSAGVAQIISKKYKTPYDWQRLMLLLNSMRMAANSTFLIDKETNYSPKLYELKHILIDKLDVKEQKRKVIIFSEWINMLNLIGEVLKEIDLGYVMLTGKVPVKNRKKLVHEFEDNEDCQVFLSTESGGAGLNLQVADTVINFELPWNPAKKNQRIGRIDRLGQKSQKLHVYNLISIQSIEEKIASGLLLKQNLFDGVLNEGNSIDEVDFTAKGKGQFIKEIESMLHQLEDQPKTEEEKLEQEMLNGVAQVENEFLAEQEEEDILENELTKTPDKKVIDTQSTPNSSSEPTTAPSTSEPSAADLAQVLNKGMDFLGGIYKMATGKDMVAEGGQRIEVDEETGEVTLKFKFK